MENVDGFDKFLEFFGTYWPIFGVVALEILARVFPSDKFRSILSYVGKICHGIGDIVYKISDGISAVVPDKPAAPPIDDDL